MIWNYKTAVLSALVRAGIFFVVNLRAGRDAAIAAMMTELVFRFITSGFYGALTQSFRRMEPPAAGLAAALVVLPLVAHSLEWCVHRWRGTPALGASIAASILFTLVSTTFNLFAMRQGVLVMGEGRQSLLDDLRALPRLAAAFLATVVRGCSGA